MKKDDTMRIDYTRFVKMCKRDLTMGALELDARSCPVFVGTNRDHLKGLRHIVVLTYSLLGSTRRYQQINHPKRITRASQQQDVGKRQYHQRASPKKRLWFSTQCCKHHRHPRRHSFCTTQQYSSEGAAVCFLLQHVPQSNDSNMHVTYLLR